MKQPSTPGDAMAHLRARHMQSLLSGYGKFWPVVGLLGLRQSGKSTLFRESLHLGKYVTLDDVEIQDEAKNSPKNFLQKLSTPLVLDEVQRAPALFDTIKLLVDQNKRPGMYYLTGSSQFSAKLGIRESLTGRMGILYFYPFTLSEIYKKPLLPKRVDPLFVGEPRFTVEQALCSLETGSLPVPLFTRKGEMIRSYFQSWMETSLLRDAARAYGKGYDSEIAYSMIQQIAQALKNGEYATLKHFKQDSRKVRKYLQCFEDIFLLYKIPPSAQAVGSDFWTFSDTGIASYLMGTVLGEGVHLSLIRIFVHKEIKALCEYSDRRLKSEYFKTARSSPVDFIWKGIPVKISTAASSQIDYDLRGLRAAMTKLKSKQGILLTSRERVEKEGGISIVPWTYFS